MSQNKKVIGVGIITFLFLLIYFTCSYKYYPGLQVGFSGQIEKETLGKLYWDYGYGFNAYDSIEIALSADIPINNVPLGTVSFEPAGFKSDNSRGYLFWLVVPQDIYEANSFKIEGKHHWGSWLHVNAKMQGRQLALFPGSRIDFISQSNLFQFYYFKTPQAGFAKLHSKDGSVQYIDGYGKNLQLTVTPEVYKEEGKGALQYVSDPFRNKKEQHIYLPRQKLAGLRIELLGQQVKDIIPLKKLRISPAKFDLIDKSKSVSVEQILVNGIQVELNAESVKYSGEPFGRGLEFTHENDYIEISGEITSYEIYLPKGTQSKAVEITVDDRTVDLKGILDKKGRYVFGDTARKIYYTPTVDNVEVIDWTGKSLNVKNAGGNGITIINEFKALQQNQFRQILLIVQFCTAIFGALLVSKIISVITEEKKKLSPAGILSVIFVLEKRWLFWSIFLCGFLLNFLFLLAEWPGSLTPDSVTVLREARWLEFTNHHPYIYSLLLLALLNIFDAPLAVIIIQMITFHFLASCFFYILYRKGLKLTILLPCFLLSLCSLPINFFNITLWKDIPYSILVLFWAMFLSYILYVRIYEKSQIQLSAENAFLLAGSFFLLCTLRHNGLVYLPIIPIILWFLLRDSRTRFFQFIAVSLVLFLSYFMLLPEYVLQKNKIENDFAQEVTVEKVSGLKTVINNASDKYYLEDYLAERVNIFIKTLGTSPYVWLWNNDMHKPPQRWFSVDEVRAEMKVSSPCNFLSSLEKRLLGTLDFKGIFAGRFLYWNSLFALCALVAVFILSRWFPVSAFYSSFFLYQAAFMFVVVWPRWRYLYFLYLGGVFLAPILLFELRKLRFEKKRKTDCLCETI